MGRWQREYESKWCDYTQGVIHDFCRTYADQCSSSITQADEYELQKVLAVEGIAHVPPNHSRWRAPIPASQSPLTAFDAQDSLMSVGSSYVYNTPPPPDTQDIFPAFSSQEDFECQLTSRRRLSASQRLQLRMADMSPIAGDRRTSIECATTISPPSGTSKSPWTPRQSSPKLIGKTRRTPRRSLEARFKGDDLNVSIQSIRLCDDEESQMEDKKTEAEDTQMTDMSEVYDEEEKASVGSDYEDDAEQEKEIDRVDVAADEQGVDPWSMIKHDDDAEDMNMFKELVFLKSDSEDDKERETKEQVDADAVVEEKRVNTDTSLTINISGKSIDASLSPKSLTERPTSASEHDFEFLGTENDCNNNIQQPQSGEKDVEMHGLARSVVESAPCSSSAIQTVGEPSQEDTNYPVDQQQIPAQTTRTLTPTSANSNSVARQSQPVLVRRSTGTLPANLSPQTRTPHAWSKNLPARETSYTRPTTVLTRDPAIALSSVEKTTFAVQAASSVQKALHAYPAPASTAQTLSAVSASSKSALSRKRANRSPLLRTKLPLQMEYRFASDKRRRHRRRKSLAAKPGVFPYVVPELLVELQPYQKKALEWMLKREKELGGPITIDQQRRGEATAVDALVAKVRGGVLADEMGLGKTICCLALICESLRLTRAADAQARSETGSTVSRLTPPTLIVTPLSILSQWKQELQAKTNLSVVTYQGGTRKSFRSATQFMGADIVLSTYDTLRLLECKVQDKDIDHDDDEEDSDGTRAKDDGWHQAPRLVSRSKKSVLTSKLHQLQWFRVILDESHLIANAGCGRARAAFTLSSKRRWCVTGTPIQNRTADLAALLQFVGLGNRAHTLSEQELQALVPRVVMRRLKSTVDVCSRAPILELPKKTEETIVLDFDSDVERALYILLHRSTKWQVLRYLQSKEAKLTHRTPLTTSSKEDSQERSLFMHVFELILRLRQLCNSCALVTANPFAEVETRVNSAEALAGNGVLDGISPFSTGEIELLKRLQKQHTDANGLSGYNPLESTKLTALMQELKKVRACRERVLVISQWTSYLDMIGERLEIHNAQCEARVLSVNDASEAGNEAIMFAKLDGRMSVKDREQVVRNFQQHEDTFDMGPVVGPPLDVLLLSLRTGGLGLNLTAAAHVFIMEPSWNPSLERQAIDRAHRFGQTREVRVVRFIIKGSIEERVVALQHKKRQLTAAFLGDGGIISSAKENRLHESRLSTGDLRRLFFTQHEQDVEEDQHYHDDENDGVEDHEDGNYDDSAAFVEFE
ncbi:unnamed protein product [Peronospora belbahrii]|uniref:Helicase ATP-binding domain-containing protein n=1 Tax=Peronospora belbahrii TaxID=622444 RepID=A0ABN8D732_9STRA|nr:unnamed protein product [Peronospora belbahrii]